MEKQFEIRSDEGLPIRGVLHLPPDPACLVVVVHGFKGFKDWGFFPWIAQSLAAAGFAACRFDMSRSGIGERPGEFDRLDLFADDTYSIELADLRRVVLHAGSLPELSRLPIFLVGHSRGGGVAILAAQDTPRLRGVVTWNGIAEVVRWDGAALAQWRREGHYDVVNARTGQVMRMSTAVLDDIECNRQRLDIAAAAAALHVPLLVLQGGSDETIPLKDAPILAAQAHDASLVIISRGTHTFGATHPLREVTSELALAMKLTQHFIAMRLREG